MFAAALGCGQSSAEVPGAELAARAQQTTAEVGKELSAVAQAWIAGFEPRSAMDTLMRAGRTVTPTAVALGEALSSAVDSDHVVEPIYRELTPEDIAAVDAAIGDLPRVEVVDGVTVGYKQLDELSLERYHEERGYLVVWRTENRMIGLLYRSSKTIDVDALIALTPRLMKVTSSTLEAIR